jgi:hypothetical protein
VFPLRIVKRLALVALAGIALGCLLFMLNVVVHDPTGTLDFANFYTAGRILHQGSGKQLYDLALQEKVEREITPSGPFLPYYHPPFEAWLFAAFAFFSYPHAFLLWAVMNLALVVLIAWLLRFTGYRLDTEGHLVWLAICLPLVTGVLVLGQDSLFLAAAFLLGYLALKRRWDFAAGLALGLGLFRFEILLPFAFVFLLRRRWKVLAGFSAAGLAALGASVAAVGTSGIVRYVEALVAVGGASNHWSTGADASTMPSLRGGLITLLGSAIPHALLFPLVLAGTLALLGWAAWQFRSIARPEAPTFDLEFSLAAVAALLSSYHIFVHELTPLIAVGFLMLAYEGQRPRRGLLGNRRGTALLLVLTLVFAIGGGIFYFRDFSVLFVVLLGMMVWLAQEIADLRGLPAASSFGE